MLRIYVGVLLLVLLCGGGYFGYRYYLLTQELGTTQTQLVASQAQLTSVEDQFAQAQHALSLSEQNAQQLEEKLSAQATETDALASRISDMQGTVGTLVKLRNTDSQLLEKYSKVYFLSENYVPSSLTPIPTTYVTAKKDPQTALTQVIPFLTHMIDDASSTNVHIAVYSAYRSFAEQTSLKNAYTVTYGSGANKFSADQGYSEHQLGTTFDFTTPEIGGVLTGYDHTSAYAWMTANAYKYGFILSYPPHNSYYMYEPWHWRFVGIKLATDLHNANQYFYQMDQRTIDTYLVSLFDPQ